MKNEVNLGIQWRDGQVRIVNSFRNRGVRTVVDTLEQAEFDFASHQIPAAAQDRIAAQLRAVPRSIEDRVLGDLRIREMGDWDVCFIIALDGRDWVITIAGVEVAGTLESCLKLLLRAGKGALPDGVQTLLEGRKPE